MMKPNSKQEYYMCRFCCMSTCGRLYHLYRELKEIPEFKKKYPKYKDYVKYRREND